MNFFLFVFGIVLMLVGHVTAGIIVVVLSFALTLLMNWSATEPTWGASKRRRRR